MAGRLALLHRATPGGRALTGPGPAGAARTAAALAGGVLALVLACAGCSHVPGPGRAHGTAPATASQAPPPRTPAPATGGISLGCSTASAKAPSLTGVHPAMVPMPGNPFGVVVTRDGQWGFVSLGASVGVVRIGASLAPSLVTTIGVSGEPAGEALTPDGRYLLVASDSGAIVISVARAEQRSPDAVVGTLGTGSRVRFAGGAIEVALSPSGEFAFVTLESSGEMAVFNLARALAHGFGPDDYVGAVRLGMAPVGMAVSPDGRWLYATSELRSGGTAPEPGGGGTGTLTVIDLRRAETQPGRSVVATVNAGCEPVRVVTSAYGDDVWVTARGSDALLCFSAAALRDDPARSLIAKVRVGVAPVGLALAGDGSRIVVADSNRFGVDGATASLAVVNVADALAGKPALTGYISAGMFPRQFALEPDGRVLLVTNYLSRQLEAVPLAAVP